MNDETKKEENENTKVDESGSIHISEFLKISDPETSEIIVNKRDS